MSDATAVAPPCLLVVDDDAAVASLLADLLGALGYDVVTAENGRRALARLAERPVSLVISDVMMPVLDGPGFYNEAVQQFPHLRHRFVWITGEVPPGPVRDALNATGAPLLRKPFTLDAVRHVVRQLLASS